MADDPLVYYFRLVKGGYAHSVLEAAKLDARTVLQALAYDTFVSNFERAYIEKNKAS